MKRTLDLGPIRLGASKDLGNVVPTIFVRPALGAVGLIEAGDLPRLLQQLFVQPFAIMTMAISTSPVRRSCAGISLPGTQGMAFLERIAQR
jgi:hypothetical protein